jgi:hypothetical protein
MVLVDQGGRWMLTHKTAMTKVAAFYINALGRVHGI